MGQESRFQIGHALVVIQMIGIYIGNAGDQRIEIKERTIRFIGLGHQVIARAVKEMSFIKYSRPREEVEKELLAKYSSTS